MERQQEWNKMVPRRMFLKFAAFILMSLLAGKSAFSKACPSSMPYHKRKKKLLRGLDRRMKHLKKVLSSYYDEELTDAISRECREEYESLIPEMPCFGDRMVFFLFNLYMVGATQQLALYRVLTRQGRTTEEAAKIGYEVTDLVLHSYPRLVRRFIGFYWFCGLGARHAGNQAAESQKREYPDNWVMVFIEGDGHEFDWGNDYTECAICKFYHAQGADELIPYMCRHDYAMSSAFGWGLRRTMTIAEGFDRCDFRFYYHIS